MRFDPEKLKLMFEYVVENCKAGDTVPSTFYKGISEAEMFEYAHMSYSEGLLQFFEDCSSLNDVGCLIGNPTIRGYELYRQMNEPEKWNKVKTFMESHGITCISEVLGVMVDKAIDFAIRS